MSREEQEREMRVNLKRANYGYGDLARECDEDGLTLTLWCGDGEGFEIAVFDGSNPVAVAEGYGLTATKLDVVARRVRAMMGVGGDVA